MTRSQSRENAFILVFENLFNPDTYMDDNLEWDLIIYATPAPKTDS